MRPAPPRFYRRWCLDYSLRLEKEPQVFLTFDDGPDPEVTPLVLDMLKNHNARATFFCIGRNAANHPDLIQKIIAEGHGLGNHSFTHQSAWKSERASYLADIQKCQEVFRSFLFRPPFGRLTRPLSKSISRQHKIILWNLLSYDYDETVTDSDCLSHVLQYLKPGSVVVFHDRKPLQQRMERVLPAILEYIKEKNWEAAAIPGWNEPAKFLVKNI